LPKPVKEYKVDNLMVRIYPDRKQMGLSAALDVAEKMKSYLQNNDYLRMIFAAAPSQIELLSALTDKESLDWSRVTAFHMDEYIGLTSSAPQGFGNFLKKYLFDHLPFKEIHFINPESENPDEESSRYAQILDSSPIDLVCMGIGENGHIAFNDPPVADFNDPVSAKTVTLEERCRQQQVNDGCFTHITEVPQKAITLTIPVFLKAHSLIVVVPDKSKAEAVFNTLNGPISTSCPASILRSHKEAILYLDEDSSKLL